MSSHYYDAEGYLVTRGAKGAWPSPTTALDIRRKVGLEQWRERVGYAEAHRKTEEGQVRGTIVHGWIEEYLSNGQIITESMIQFRVHPIYGKYIEGFLNWFGDRSPEILLSEAIVESKKYKYRGRLDLLCSVDGLLEPWLVDFKTSSQLDPGMGLQLKMYQQAVREEHQMRPKMMVVKLGTGTKKNYKEYEYNEPLNAAIAHLTILRWQNKHDPAPIEWDGGIIGT